MARKKYKPVRNYSLLNLLSKQPGLIKKNNDYRNLANIYNASESLKKIRFTRKCYTLLNNCKILPGHLDDFYKTYRFPKNPFFPLFLKTKKEYLDKKKSDKKKRDEYIFKRMKSLPDDIKIYLGYLAKFERSINVRKRYPEWSITIYPGTRKKIDKLFKSSRIQWAMIFFAFIEKLGKRYNNVNLRYGNKIAALFVFELPIRKHTEEEIKARYRMLSKKYHPDAGGSGDHFNLLQKARDILSDH
jgi:hypothetical protein